MWLECRPEDRVLVIFIDLSKSDLDKLLPISSIFSSHISLEFRHIGGTAALSSVVLRPHCYTPQVYSLSTVNLNILI
jgi:hypothetical protein